MSETMDQTRFLNAAFKTGDREKVCAAVLTIVLGSGNVSEFALKAGIDRSMLYGAFKRNLGFGLLLKVIRAADLNLIVVDHPQPKAGSSLSKHLTNVLSSNDIKYVVRALSTTLRAQDNVTEFAKRVGVRRETLYKSLTYPHVPKLATVLKFLEALDLRLAVRKTED